MLPGEVDNADFTNDQDKYKPVFSTYRKWDLSADGGEKIKQIMDAINQINYSMNHMYQTINHLNERLKRIESNKLNQIKKSIFSAPIQIPVSKLFNQI